jgi:hypothetical protein
VKDDKKTHFKIHDDSDSHHTTENDNQLEGEEFNDSDEDQ